MATEDLYIIVIEIGSVNVTGVAAKKLPDGTINVQSVVQESALGFVRRGIIYNPIKAAQCLTAIKQQFENSLNRTITQVYVGYGCQSMRTIFNKVSLPLDSDVSISEESIASLKAINKESIHPNLSLIDVVPQEYLAGKELSVDPIGILADNLEGRYLNIVARPSCKINLDNAFQQAGLPIVDLLITPLAEANALLSESEKRSGCVFVDFGAETTSVAVYKENMLRYFAVIPLGSGVITRDIANCCQTEDSVAEQIKANMASAINMVETIEEGKQVAYTFPDGHTVDKLRLAQIVEGRCEEILRNVHYQIKESKLDFNSLMSGAVITGEGSGLKNLAKAFSQITNINNVRIINTVPNVQFNKSVPSIYTEGKITSTLCLLAEAPQNCCVLIEKNGFGDMEPVNAEKGSTSPTEQKEQAETKEKDKGSSFGEKISVFLEKIFKE